MENLPFIIPRSYEEFDVFGTPISLSYNQKPVYQTKCGATLSLICCFLSIILIVISGKEVFEKSNPTIITYEYLMSKHDMMKFNDNFFFFFGIIDSNFKPIQDKDSSYFNFTLQYIDKLNNISYNLEIDYCSKSNAFQNQETRQLFSEIDVDNYFCLKDVNKINQLDFKGQFGSLNYKYFQINLQTCTIKSCYNQNVIDLLLNSYFIFYFTEIVFNPKSYNNPLTKFSNNVYTKLSLYNKKNLLFKMKHSQYLTDTGYFYENMEVNNFTTYDSVLESIKLNPDNQSDIVTFQTQIGDKAHRIQRKYLKITDLLAYLGGFLKIIFLLGQIIALPVNKIALETEFTNNIFNFEKPTKRKQKEDQEENEENIERIQNQSKSPKQINQDKQMKQIDIIISPIASEIPISQIHSQKNSPMIDQFNKINNNNNLNNQLRLNKRRNSYAGHQLTESKEKNNNKQQSNQNIQRKLFNNISKRKTCILQAAMKNQNKTVNKNNKIYIMQKIMKNYNNNNQDIISKNDYDNSILKIGKRVKHDAHLIFQELLNILHKNIKIKIYDYLLYIWAETKQMLCCSKQYSLKQQQIKNAINLLTERMDLVFIMNKLMEFEKLKLLVLDKDQLEIFKFLPKPLVKYKNNSKSDLNINDNLAQNYQDQLFQQQNEKSYEKCLKAAKAFQRIKNKKKKTKMDINVLEIIGQRSQKLLDFLEDSNNNNNSEVQINKENSSNKHSYFNLQKKQVQNSNLSSQNSLNSIIRQNSKINQVIQEENDEIYQIKSKKYINQQFINLHQEQQQIYSLQNFTQNNSQIESLDSQKNLKQFNENGYQQSQSAKRFDQKHYFVQMPKKEIEDNQDQDIDLGDDDQQQQ